MANLKLIRKFRFHNKNNPFFYQNFLILMGKTCSILISFKNKAYIILGFLAVFYVNVNSQNQKRADSLELIYTSGNFKEQDRLKILKDLAYDHADPDKKLTYSLELIQLATELDSTKYLWNAYTMQGTALRSKGDYDKALESHIKAVQIAIDEKSNTNLGKAYITIADVYSVMENHSNSIDYYHQAIDILRKENDSSALAGALYNTGDEYVFNKKYDSAKIYFKESSLIFKNINNLTGSAYNLGSIGLIYAEQGNYALAKENINQAITILEELQLYTPISEFLIGLADIYIDQNDLITALSYTQRSLELAQKYGLKKNISESNQKLSEIYQLDGNLPESYKYYKDHIAYRDSVTNIATVQKIADQITDFEVQKKEDEILFLEKEAEINELKDKRHKTLTYISFATAFFILLLAVGTIRRYRFIKKTNHIIQEETYKSERLLLNILPEETALELKQSGKVQAKKFDSVSVMFTDFIEFTRFSHKLSPEDLVKSVDFYFSKFDEIIEKYDLEKIKTIGDSYMCAGGLPFPTTDHTEKIIQAAFEITEFIEESKKMDGKKIKAFEVRIGINTGPVVAGVVGTKKFAYDIWGDTVNVASRMECNSSTGKINISEYTYELIKDKYDCEYRGQVHVKNKGMMKMYFVNGLKKTEV